MFSLKNEGKHMSEGYPNIPKLTPVTKWPEREFPQERFDRDIANSMNQMSVMVDELNNEIIPSLNTVTKNFMIDLDNVSANIQESKEDNANIRAEFQKINNTLVNWIEYVNALGEKLSEIGTLKENIEKMVNKIGQRGKLAGSEKAVSLVGSQKISIESPDAINLIGDGGTLKLSFEHGEDEDRAIKVICMMANSDTIFEMTGAEWATGTDNINWGKAGSFMIVVASFIGGRVILTVADRKNG